MHLCCLDVLPSPNLQATKQAAVEPPPQFCHQAAAVVVVPYPQQQPGLVPGSCTPYPGLQRGPSACQLNVCCCCCCLCQLPHVDQHLLQQWVQGRADLQEQHDKQTGSNTASALKTAGVPQPRSYVATLQQPDDTNQNHKSTTVVHRTPAQHLLYGRRYDNVPSLCFVGRESVQESI